jgi:transmembrane sensor
VVRALGTVFRLRVTDENQCELMVMSGAVAVAAGSLPSRVVTAGQSAWINPAGTTVQEVSPEEIQRRLAWRRGKIWFDGSPLSYAVAEFNRYNASVLVIDDPALAGLRLGGAFNATDVERFVRVLEKMFGVQSQVLQRSGSLEIHLRASDSSDANR